MEICLSSTGALYPILMAAVKMLKPDNATAGILRMSIYPYCFSFGSLSLIKLASDCLIKRKYPNMTQMKSSTPIATNGRVNPPS